LRRLLEIIILALLALGLAGLTITTIELTKLREKVADADIEALAEEVRAYKPTFYWWSLSFNSMYWIHDNHEKVVGFLWGLSIPCIGFATALISGLDPGWKTTGSSSITSLMSYTYISSM